MKIYRIGQLAQKTGVSADTIRYYEKEGLINAPPRSPAGYRLYSELDLQVFMFIVRGKKVGLSLKSIRELLELHTHQDEKTCADMKQFTSEKLNKIQAKIDELTQMKETLEIIAENCCGGHESARGCSILKAFEAKEKE